ncbi:hypothetical protein B0H19DRAFT_1055436 [Mycena capillaripes]|nr:hypothetical protein B0H19DRAFT_1055436 [Mycena capillaripes]
MSRRLGPTRAGRTKRDQSGLCNGIGRRRCPICKSMKRCGHGVRYLPAISYRSIARVLSRRVRWPSPPGPGGRPRRHPRLPKRYRDDPPATPTIVEPPVVKATPVVEHNTRETPPKWGTTEPNRHGLYKVLPNRPTHDPDETSSELLVAPKVPSLASATPPWFPFLNSTVARLMLRFHVGSNLKSIAELDSLVEYVGMNENFDRNHLKNFSAARENKRIPNSLGRTMRG